MAGLIAKIRKWLRLGKKSSPHREQRQGTPKGTSLDLDGANSPAAELGLAGGRPLPHDRRPRHPLPLVPRPQPRLDFALERAFPDSSTRWLDRSSRSR